MDRSQTWFAMALLLAVAASVACGGGRRYRDRLAVIEMNTDAEGVHVTLPDTVAVGLAATVTIRTYGGGCLVRDQERGGRTSVNVRDRIAVLVPFDRFDLGPRALTGSTWSCTDQLLHWTRVVPVVFDEPGSATIRVRGISSGTHPKKVMEVAFPLEVVSGRP
jgi:hypothetical protein